MNKPLDVEAELTELRRIVIEVAPHGGKCAILTPRPTSVSASFRYVPPRCNCWKAETGITQERARTALDALHEEEARSDHSFAGEQND